MNLEDSLFAYRLEWGLGTLWRVNEVLWKLEIRDRGYRYDSNRQWHPGLSTRRSPFNPNLEPVPLLHGTHGLNGKADSSTPFSLRGFDFHEPDEITWVGESFEPIPFRARHFSTSAEISPKSGIIRNPDKSRLLDGFKEIPGLFI